MTRKLRVAAQKAWTVLVACMVILIAIAIGSATIMEATSKTVASARAPDAVLTQITTVGIVQVAAAAILILGTIFLATQVFYKQRSTLKSRTRNGLRPTLVSFFARFNLTASEEADVGHRHPRSTFGQHSGLGSHAFKASVPFPV